MPVRVELAHRQISIEDAVHLGSGDVVELGCSIDGPVVVFVGELPLARGEIVVTDGCFAVRVTEIIESPSPVAMPAEESAQ